MFGVQDSDENMNDSFESADPDDVIAKMVQDSDENMNDYVESSFKGPHKKVKLRGRQRSFIRNPNYVNANKYFEKIFKNEHVRKTYMEHELPHPGFGDSGDKNLNDFPVDLLY
ncbi:hypothetical protein KR084_009325 [Drosophila pseudotakahashii]|nr:hypothetical protein KR084_009325 [Drosophila pseudotakahashii]